MDFLNTKSSKRNNKTLRANQVKYLSFNQITKFDPKYKIPKEIIWLIESDLDNGVFELSKYYNIPVYLTYDDEDFIKQPPNILTNVQFSSAGNMHNLVVFNKKRNKSFYYYPNGKKHEFLSANLSGYGYDFEHNNDIKTQKNFDKFYQCSVCKSKHKTKEAFINHKSTKQHKDQVENFAKNKKLGQKNFLTEKKNEFIQISIRINKQNYYSKSEFRKNYESGCQCCRHSSSTALTKGHGKKSSNKTKGRNKRKKYLLS